MKIGDSKAILESLMDWLNENKERWSNLETLLKVIALLVAPLIFYHEYKSKIDLEAKNRALEEIKRFRATGEYKLLDAHELSTLDDATVERMTAAAKSALQLRSLCPYHKYVVSASDETTIRRNIVSLLTQIEDVSACTNAGVCDRRETCRALGQRVHTYISDNCTPLGKLEEIWKQRISSGVRRWLDSCGDPAFRVTFCEEVAYQSRKPLGELLENCDPKKPG